MLGVGTSPQRYATLQDALQQRFGFPGIDYATMLRDNLTPGEVTAATILAADIKSTPAAIIAESQRTNTPIVDLADQHGMHAWPLEIFMGLVYLDYTDNPVTEMHPGGSGSSAGGDVVASSMGAGALFKMVSSGVDVRKVQAHVRKPFRFFLCGDPALVAEFRALMLSGQTDEALALEAAACLETLDSNAPAARSAAPDARAIVFLGRKTDASDANLAHLEPLKLPILALTVDDTAVPSAPASAPAPGSWAEYVVPEISRDALRKTVFPHLIECSHGVEIAVGRRLLSLREAAAGELPATLQETR